MSVAFDRSIWAPAMTLICKSSDLTSVEVVALANLLERNYYAVTGRKPEQQPEFCVLVIQRNTNREPLEPAEIVATQFFKSMRITTYFHPRYARTMIDFVPCILAMAQKRIPSANEKTKNEEVKKWVALCVESCITEEQSEKLNPETCFAITSKY